MSLALSLYSFSTAAYVSWAAFLRLTVIPGYIRAISSPKLVCLLLGQVSLFAILIKPSFILNTKYYNLRWDLPHNNHFKRIIHRGNKINLVYKYLASQAREDHLKCHPNQLVILDKFCEKMKVQAQYVQS